MKDHITKAIIRQRKKELGKITLALGNVRATIGAICIMLVCFIVSFVLKNTWLSNVLISVGAGFVTGLVFYWLSNLRNNKITKLQNEINPLTPAHKDLMHIANLQLMDKFPKMLTYSKMTQEDIAYQIMDCIERLASSIHKVSGSVYDELNLRIDDPFNADAYQSYCDSFSKITNASDYRAWSKEIYEKLGNIIDKVDTLMKEKEDTLQILQQKVF